MSWITELIQAIPDIIVYIAPGFLFVNGFVWVTHRQFSTHQVQIASSIVASFVLKSCFDVIVRLTIFQNDSPLSVMILCAISTVLGVLLGVITGRQWFTNVLLFFHIYRSANSSIWDDVLSGNMWMAVYDDKHGLYYCGQIRHASESDQPLIVALETYYVMNEKKDVVEWHLEYGDYVILDTSKYQIIQISKTDPFKQTEPA